MIIRISDNLKNQEIWANGNELASIMGKDKKNGKRVLDYPENEKQIVCNFANPVLITDNYRISKLKPALRDTVFSLYSSRPRIIEYDGVSVRWDEKYKTVWCPSIDTILFAKVLKKILPKLKDIRTVAEIGCGSGFLSKYLLEKNKKIESLWINDINPQAIACAKENIKDKRAKFFVGNGLKLIRNKKFDLIICNPPYIPRPKSIDDNPYEGVSLLYHFLNQGKKYLSKRGILITNISSLSEKIVLKKKPKIEILETMTVPLKVNNLMNNPSWIKYLMKNGLKKKMFRGYEYWQKINIVSIENKI
ncbi:MAG TPA: class I SAM-dependent methyltransferase [Candidatus Pacearchaeota archaeon]|nr:class I SAM-dependent methyltransferase [Candidatus Pacearchaeota archaeon]